MTIEGCPCPFIPGLAELFETPLPKISFPKESEKKVYLYCELIQRNHKINEEQEDESRDDKKSENKKVEIVTKNKEKKKTKNRKKKKKSSLTNLKVEDSTESEAIEEDPTLILPERKSMNMHKWPSRLSAPKVEPRIKEINSNSNVIYPKNKIARTIAKIIEADSSYDLLGSLLGDKKSHQNTAESNDLIGSLLKGKISSFNSDSLKAVGYDSSVCKVKHDDRSKDKNKGSISKTLQKETDDGPKRELPLPKTVKSETVNQKCEGNVEPVSHVSIDETSKTSSTAISKVTSCDLVGSSLGDPKSSSFTNTPEASDSDSNEDLGYDLSICIENEDEDDEKTVEGNEQRCSDDKKSGVYLTNQLNKQEISTLDTSVPNNHRASIPHQKRKEINLCHTSVSKPQVDLKKCVTKRKNPGQTSKGLLHSMKTLKKRTSLSANKSTPLVLRTKSMETSKDVTRAEENRKSNKYSLSIPEDTCEKGSSKNNLVSNADSKNAVSSFTGEINDKFNSFDRKKVTKDEHTSESSNSSKHAENHLVVTTQITVSNSVASSHGNLSLVLKKEQQNEKVNSSDKNQVTTGKRTSSLFDKISAEKSVKRSRTYSNENFNSINNNTTIENKTSKDEPQCKKEGDILDASERKWKQPVKRRLNESRKIVSGVSSDPKKNTEENDVSRPSQWPEDDNFDEGNDKSDGKRDRNDYNNSGNQYYKTIDYNHKSLVAPDGDHGHHGCHSSQREESGRSESYRNDNQNEKERRNEVHAGNAGRSRNFPNMQRGRRNTRSMSRLQQYEESQNHPESPKLLDLVAGAPMGTEVVQGSSQARKKDGNNKSHRYRPKGQKKSNSYWAKREQERQREREKREYDAQQPCVYYKTHGTCKYGDECRFSHDIEVDVKMECCKYYVAGACIKGDNCQFIHGDWPCKFYHVRGHCNSSDCRFSHAEMTPQMKEVFEARIQYEESMEKAAEEVEKVEPIVEAPSECSYPTEFVTRDDPVPKTECKSEGDADKPNDGTTEEPKKIEEFQFPSLYYELT